MKDKEKLTHEHFMKSCLILAEKAKANGCTPVGSVIVKGGKIIAEGMEGEEDIPTLFAHAEAIALLRALNKMPTKDLKDCILYTTVEPCFMCSYLIRQTKILGVIYGIETAEVGGASSKYPFLNAADIAKWPIEPFVIAGILAKECAALF